MTLSELRTKEVIDVQDGRRLGKVMDLEFSVEDSRITALVVPSETSFLQSLRGEKCGLVIPWEDVRRIGDDVILVTTHSRPDYGPGCSCWVGNSTARADGKDLRLSCHSSSFLQQKTRTAEEPSGL